MRQPMPHTVGHTAPTTTRSGGDCHFPGTAWRQTEQGLLAGDSTHSHAAIHADEWTKRHRQTPSWFTHLTDSVEDKIDLVTPLQTGSSANTAVVSASGACTSPTVRSWASASLARQSSASQSDHSAVSGGAFTWSKAVSGTATIADGAVLQPPFASLGSVQDSAR